MKIKGLLVIGLLFTELSTFTQIEQIEDEFRVSLSYMINF